MKSDVYIEHSIFIDIYFVYSFCYSRIHKTQIYIEWYWVDKNEQIHENAWYLVGYAIQHVSYKIVKCLTLFKSIATFIVLRVFTYTSVDWLKFMFYYHCFVIINCYANVNDSKYDVACVRECAYSIRCTTIILIWERQR